MVLNICKPIQGVDDGIYKRKTLFRNEKHTKSVLINKSDDQTIYIYRLLNYRIIISINVLLFCKKKKKSSQT